MIVPETGIRKDRGGSTETRLKFHELTRTVCFRMFQNSEKRVFWQIRNLNSVSWTQERQEGKQGEGEREMDREKLNKAAWSIVDEAHDKDSKTRERKLTEKQREFETFKRREAAMRQRRLDGSQGPAGPCRRIDPVTGEIIGLVTKTRRPPGQ